MGHLNCFSSENTYHLTPLHFPLNLRLKSIQVYWKKYMSRSRCYGPMRILTGPFIQLFIHSSIHVINMHFLSSLYIFDCLLQATEHVMFSLLKFPKRKCWRRQPVNTGRVSLLARGCLASSQSDRHKKISRFLLSVFMTVFTVSIVWI